MGVPAPRADQISTAELDAAGLKAYRRLADLWGLTAEDAAALVDVAPRTWARMRLEGWAGRISQDQRLRLSALVGLYKALHLYFSDDLADRWPRLANDGPLFRGATPVEAMKAGGLPTILKVRTYVDALRGGV